LNGLTIESTLDRA